MRHPATPHGGGDLRAFHEGRGQAELRTPGDEQANGTGLADVGKGAEQPLARLVLRVDQLADIHAARMLDDLNVQFGITLHGQQAGLKENVLCAWQGKGVFTTLVQRRGEGIAHRDMDPAGVLLRQADVPHAPVLLFGGAVLFDLRAAKPVHRHGVRRGGRQAEPNLPRLRLLHFIDQFVMYLQFIAFHAKEGKGLGGHTRRQAMHGQHGRVGLFVVAKGEAGCVSGNSERCALTGVQRIEPLEVARPHHHMVRCGDGDGPDVTIRADEAEHRDVDVHILPGLEPTGGHTAGLEQESGFGSRRHLCGQPEVDPGASVGLRIALVCGAHALTGDQGHEVPFLGHQKIQREQVLLDRPYAEAPGRGQRLVVHHQAGARGDEDARRTREEFGGEFVFTLWRVVGRHRPYRHLRGVLRARRGSGPRQDVQVHRDQGIGLHRTQREALIGGDAEDGHMADDVDRIQAGERPGLDVRRRP